MFASVASARKPIRRRLAAAITLCGAVALFACLIASDTAEAKKKAGWQSGYAITEYYPAPEAWANGKSVKIPGAGGATGRIDWLYGRHGIAMEGDGVTTDGRRFHIYGLGSQGWVKKNGRPTSASSGFSEGRPYWRDVGWRTNRGRVTYPLPGKNNWSAGKPKRRGKGSARRPISFKGITFAPGPSRPLNYWRSVAVDPGTIPLGSKVYIPEYSSKPGGGCFRADDTGSAINGKHLDVYRPAPSSPSGGSSMSGVRVYVVPKGKKVPRRAPRCLKRDIPSGSIDDGVSGGGGGLGAPRPGAAGRGAIRAGGGGFSSGGSVNQDSGAGGAVERDSAGLSTGARSDGILTPEQLASICAEGSCEVSGGKSSLGPVAYALLVGVTAFLYG